MSARAAEHMSLAGAKDPAEESIPLRTLVALAVLISIAAILAQDVVASGTGLAALAMVGIGFMFSYMRRDSNQIAVKFVLAAGLVLAFANFLRSIGGATSIDDARAPLAEIFLWVQVLHSFDLPRRKDLQFSVASSVALIALGGSISIDASYLLFFVPWGIAALGALALTHHSELEETNRATPIPRVRGPKSGRGGIGWLWRPVATSLALIVIGGSAAFLFAPRGRGMQLTSLPFEIQQLIPIPQGSGIVNRGLPNADGPSDTPAAPDPDTYFGFANFVDLRVRGTLSDEVVMRVRAPQRAFWRATVFDTYDDSAWTNSSDSTRPSAGTPTEIPPERGVRVRSSTELTQTFYVERSQSNIIFAAYHPEEVWFPGGTFDIADTRAMRARFVLEEGTVYSVVSQIPTPTREELEASGDELHPAVQDEQRAIVERYTRLPPDLPQRVKDLAHDIAYDQPTALGKVLAIEEWLQENTVYDLDIPPQPAGTDAVDHFLFTERRGFCEQIASSLAIMLRTLGVPARFAVGYESGERNIFSGYFEVRARNAHSWVEVYFPLAGWVQFDPTHEVPLAEPELGASTPGVSFLKRLFSAMGSLIPDGLLATIGRMFQAAFRAVISSGPVAAAVLVGAAGLAAAVRFFAPRVSKWLRRRKWRRRGRRQPEDVVPRAFRILELAGEEAGFPRPPYVTPGEYGRTLTFSVPSFSKEDVQRIVSALERELYGGEPIEVLEARVAEEAALRLLASAPAGGKI